MKTLMTTILTLMIFGTANAASIDTYANGVTFKTSCDKLVELWEVTNDSVSNNELYLEFDDAEAICDNESFTLRFLAINDVSGNDMNLSVVNEDFGKRQFQIVRRYGNPTSITESNGEKFLNYIGTKVDVSFSIGTGIVSKIHLDFKRIIQNNQSRNPIEIFRDMKRYVDTYIAKADHYDSKEEITLDQSLDFSGSPCSLKIISKSLRKYDYYSNGRPYAKKEEQRTTVKLNLKEIKQMSFKSFRDGLHVVGFYGKYNREDIRNSTRSVRQRTYNVKRGVWENEGTYNDWFFQGSDYKVYVRDFTGLAFESLYDAQKFQEYGEELVKACN